MRRKPSGEGRGGSSTMPHKRNPVAAASAVAAATMAPNLAATIFAAQVQDHERSAGPWHAEWPTLPMLLLVTSGALASIVDIAEGLVQSGVRRLVVAGGETSGAVVDRLSIPGFLVGPEIAAGVPVLRAVGAKEGEMLLALKSGNFGGPEFFSDALKLMR